jgi:hypothetical protein
MTCKPEVLMDLLTSLGRQFRAWEQLVQLRASRNPNEIIEKKRPSERALLIPWRVLVDRGPSSRFS